MKILFLFFISFSSLSQSVTYSSKEIYKQKIYHLSIVRDVKGNDSTYTFLYKDMRYPMLDQYDGLILGSKTESILFFKECIKVYDKTNKEEKTITKTEDGTVFIYYEKYIGTSLLVIFKQEGGMTKVTKNHLENIILALDSN